MKEQYDFSKAERGKFHNPKAIFHLPIYLESDIEEIIIRLAQKKGVETQFLVNMWLRNSIQLLETVS